MGISNLEIFCTRHPLVRNKASGWHKKMFPDNYVIEKCVISG